MYVLDTDYLTALRRGGSAAHKLAARLDKIEPLEIATTIINYEEQSRGWFSFAAQARTIEKQITAYKLLRSNLDDFCGCLMFDFDDQAAATFQRLQQARIRIGTMDLKIAAVVLVNNAVLLTRNLSDFNQIPDLLAENWLD